MTRRRWLRRALTTTRSVAGAAIAAGIVVIVAAAVAAPWPVVTGSPASVDVLPAPGDTVIVCGGPVLAAGRIAEDADRITVAADPKVVVGTSTGSPEESLLSAPDADGSGGVPIYTAAPAGGQTTPIAGASSTTLAAEDLSGFTADACRAPLFESWLVGGSTSTGAADLVLIGNPGDVTAIVEITVFGASGAFIPPGGLDVAVPGKTQRVIPLSGLALGEETPVLRLSSTGGPVRASLQSSIVRTLVPGGVDQVSAIAAPDPVQIIPGVTVTAPPGVAGASDSTTIVRLLSPSVAATASVVIAPVGAPGSATAPREVPLEPGIPAELDLGGLAQGAYVVTATATSPIVAAVWQSTGFGAGSDFAWLTSTPPLDAPTLIAVPSGPSPLLQLANLGVEDATVVLSAVTGTAADRTIVVPAGGSGAIALGTGMVWSMDLGGARDVHAALMLTARNAIAGFAVWPADAAAQRIRVYP